MCESEKINERKLSVFKIRKKIVKKDIFLKKIYIIQNNDYFSTFKNLKKKKKKMISQIFLII